MICVIASSMFGLADSFQLRLKPRRGWQKLFRHQKIAGMDQTRRWLLFTINNYGLQSEIRTLEYLLDNLSLKYRAEFRSSPPDRAREVMERGAKIIENSIDQGAERVAANK